MQNRTLSFKLQPQLSITTIKDNSIGETFFSVQAAKLSNSLELSSCIHTGDVKVTFIIFESFIWSTDNILGAHMNKMYRPVEPLSILDVLPASSLYCIDRPWAQSKSST